MKVRWSFALGLSASMVLGAARADDIVSIGVLPGTSISIRNGCQVQTFGQDPPTSMLDNVLIADDGTLTVAQGDIFFAPIDFVVMGFMVHAQLRPQSDGTGTYDRASGSATASLIADLKITSNAPGFNNNNCIVPATALSVSTDNTGGSLCSGGNCTLVDNTFVVDRIPAGSCGSFLFYNYTNIVNDNLCAPSLNPGDNILTLVVRMTPALDP
jgi:hypothetical protein